MKHTKSYRDDFTSENNTAITILYKEECPDKWRISVDIFTDYYDYLIERLIISYNDSSTFKCMLFKSDTKQHICPCEDMMQIVINFINTYSKQKDNWDIVIDKVKHYVNMAMEKHCNS